MSGTNLLERPFALATRSPRAVCIATMALVFLTGAVIGALAMDLGIHNRMRPAAFDTPQGKALNFERLRKELDLTPAQSEQMQTVLNDFWQYYRTVLSDSKQRVEQVLNEEQRQKFEKILQQQTR